MKLVFVDDDRRRSSDNIGFVAFEESSEEMSHSNVNDETKGRGSNSLLSFHTERCNELVLDTGCRPMSAFLSKLYIKQCYSPPFSNAMLGGMDSGMRMLNGKSCYESENSRNRSKRLKPHARPRRATGLTDDSVLYSSPDCHKLIGL